MEELRRRAGIQQQHGATLYDDSETRAKSLERTGPGTREYASEQARYSPLQRRAELTLGKGTQRPWYELDDSVPAKGRDESLAREDPLNLFKKKAKRPSSSSYLAVQKAKAQRYQRPRPA